MKKKSRAEEYGVSESTYKEYLEKYDKKSAVFKKAERKKRAAAWKSWWKDNWIAFFSMLLSVIAVIVAILK